MNTMEYTADVTVGFLDYDWRTGSNCPMPAPSTVLAPRAKVAFSACDPQTPAVFQTSHRDIGPAPTGPPGRTCRAKSPYQPESSLRKSTLAPGLVPDFFRSHVGPTLNVKSKSTVEEGLGLVSPRQSARPPLGPPPPIKYTPTNSSFAPSLFSMGVPLKPHMPIAATAIATSIATRTVAPSLSPSPPPNSDPAANMLCMLESRLQNIKTAVRALPRTGFSNTNKACLHIAPASIRAPQMATTKATPNDIEMNDYFVALVSCDEQSKALPSQQVHQMQTPMIQTSIPAAAPAQMMPMMAPMMQVVTPAPMVPTATASVSPLGKRTADMMMHTQVTSNQEFTYAAELGKLKAKTENLKQRNRESAKASRDRKKAQLDALSAQIDELTANNLKLAQTCQDVAIENKKLKVDLQELGYMGDFTDLAEIAAKAEADGIIIDDANTSDSEAVTNAKAIEDADAKAESIDQIETTASMDIVEETQRDPVAEVA